MTDTMLAAILDHVHEAVARVERREAEERAGRRVAEAFAALDLTYRANPKAARLVRQLAEELGEPPDLVFASIANAAAHGRAADLELRARRGRTVDVQASASRCAEVLPAALVLDVVLGALHADVEAVAVALEVALVAAPRPEPEPEAVYVAPEHPERDMKPEREEKPENVSLVVAAPRDPDDEDEEDPDDEEGEGEAPPALDPYGALDAW